jgi:hypothetical protein
VSHFCVPLYDCCTHGVFLTARPIWPRDLQEKAVLKSSGKLCERIQHLCFFDADPELLQTMVNLIENKGRLANLSTRFVVGRAANLKLSHAFSTGAQVSAQAIARGGWCSGLRITLRRRSCARPSFATAPPVELAAHLTWGRACVCSRRPPPSIPRRPLLSRTRSRWRRSISAGACWHCGLSR